MTAPGIGTSRAGTVGRIALVAVLTAGCWFGWLGWDVEYQTDPLSGVASGPYEAWQVAGALLCLVMVVIGATVLLGPVAAVATTAATFAISWSITQATRDVTGMWLVGAILVLFGVAAGATVVAVATTAVAKNRRRGKAT